MHGASDYSKVVIAITNLRLAVSNQTTKTIQKNETKL